MPYPISPDAYNHPDILDIQGLLRPRRALFVHEYLKDLNALSACKRAGFAACESYSGELMRDPHVKEGIRRAMEDRAQRVMITQDSVIAELSRIAFANLGDLIVFPARGNPYFDIAKLTPEMAASVVEITVEEDGKPDADGIRAVRRVRVKLADKLTALVQLGKHLGMFKEGSSGASITININGDDAAL